MRRRLYITGLALIASLALTGQAQAVTLTPDSLHDRATLHAVQAGEAFWHVDPCPQGLRVATYDGTYPPTGGEVAGLPGSAVASAGDCTIWLNRAWWWPPFDGTDSAGLTWPVAYCQIIVHEWGHLVLGYLYFAASNPADPAHSPDPHSIMYRSPIVVPPECARLARGGPARRVVRHRHRPPRERKPHH